MNYYSAIKKNQIMSFVNMSAPEDYHKWSQRKTNIKCYWLYAESKKKTDTNELIYKTETLTDLKNEFMITRSKEAEIDW